MVAADQHGMLCHDFQFFKSAPSKQLSAFGLESMPLLNDEGLDDPQRQITELIKDSELHDWILTFVRKVC